MHTSQYLRISIVATSLVVLAGCITAQAPVDTNLAGNTAGENANTSDVNTAVENTNGVNTNQINSGNESTSVDSTNETVSDTLDISDWLTYTNEEYGFSFKYPREWEIKDYSKTNVFINVPNQVLRLQFNSDQTEYHMVLYKDNVQNIIDEIKNDDPSASFVKAENDISINSNSYKYVSVLAAIGSLVDYYIQSYGTDYTIVWVANPYTDQAIIRAWISTFR